MVSTHYLGAILCTLSLLALEAAAFSCRRCTCHPSFAGNTGEDTMDAVNTMGKMFSDWVAKHSGGDGLTWSILPSKSSNFEGTAYVHRLCGTSSKADINPDPQLLFGDRELTYVDGKCDCDKAVACNAGTHCDKYWN